MNSINIKIYNLLKSPSFLLVFIVCSVFIFFSTSKLGYAGTENYALTKDMLDTVEINNNYEGEQIKPSFDSGQRSLTTAPLFLLHSKNIEQTQPTLTTKLDLKDLSQQLKDYSSSAKPENALFEASEGKVINFNPGKNGFLLDIPKTIIATTKNLSFSPVGITSPPQVTLSSTNSMGIKELLGRGRSSFKGSSKNRRTNIKVALEKNKGVLVAPGSKYSFNEQVGGVEAKDGFVPEIVIKSTGLTPELGGGVCQVSSTVFRGAVASGLPIEERKNHSFAVSHYAPQGTDATTYSGVIDLKFTNNTPGYILIWPYYENEDTIIFDFYGTRDNRKVELEEPTSYDRKPDGSMKTNWVRTVTLGGVDLEDNFRSNYLPPAIFKKVETFVPAQNPDTTIESTSPEPNTTTNEPVVENPPST